MSASSFNRTIEIIMTGIQRLSGEDQIPFPDHIPETIMMAMKSHMTMLAMRPIQAKV